MPSKPGSAAIDRSEHHGLAVGAHLFGLGASAPPTSTSQFFQQELVAGRNLVPADSCLPRRVR